MQHRTFLPLAAGAAMLATACGGPAAGPAPQLPTPVLTAAAQPAFIETVDSITTTPPLDRTAWGIEVYDLDAHRPLFQLNAHKHFVPASNTKLVVTTVSMGELGPDWRYHTPVYAILDPAADTVARTLVLVGRGDPSFSGRFNPSEFAVADSLADSVAVAGIRRIGRIAIDASYFEPQGFNPSWEAGDEPWYYAAPVRGAEAGEGAVAVVVTPGRRPGDAASVDVLAPGGALVVLDSIVSDTAGNGRDLDFERRFGSDTVRISGTIAVDQSPDTSWIAVADPARYLGLQLRAALDSVGIMADSLDVVTDSAVSAALLPVQPTPLCDGPCSSIESCRVDPRTRRQEVPDTTCVTLPDPRAVDTWPDTVRLPDGAVAVRVATWASPPLADMVGGLLKPSQNWIAETLLKTLGARMQGEGSWTAGIRAEYHYLFDVVGIDSAAVYLRDGSGLSAQNLVTPNAVVQLLRFVDRQPWGSVYRQDMAEPGQQGTLEHRLVALEGRLHAKTGTIRHVNALSGYLTADDGRRLAFSILTNASGIPSGDVRAAIDGIVEAMTTIRSAP
ncbi:MAG: D-alanyl-D-alanine carboxypeptidase/D-alanyl-D-alanine-endopeptidase [Gemmatimonadota bacterium]